MKTKIRKLTGIILALSIILSCCAINFSTAAENTPVEITYYIDADNGLDTNDGLTEGAAFATFEAAHNAAVSAATDGGYNTAENTVNYVILGTTQVSWITQPAAHGYTLNISSQNGEGTFGGGSVVFDGIVNFSDITLKLNSGANFTTNGHNMTFSDTVAFTLFGSGRVFTASCYGSTVTVPQNYTLNTSNTIAHIYLAGYLKSTYNADLTFNYKWNKNSISAANVYFGGYGTNASAAYNKNVNLNFISATGINLKASDKGYTFGDEAAVQIINSSGKTITYDTALEADLFGDTALVPTFEITNGTGIADIITFTETAGTFAVDSSKYIVTATADDGTTAESKDNLLVLTSPGKYTLSYRAAPRTVTYYIDADNGADTNDGLTESAAFATFEAAHNAAVSAATAGGYNTAENTVNYVILGTTQVNWITQPAAHGYTLNISSQNGEGTFGGGSVVFDGIVNFSDITLNLTKYANFTTNGHNMTFSDTVAFTLFGSGRVFTASYYGSTVTTPQNFTLNTSNSINEIYLAGYLKSTYNADLTFNYKWNKNSISAANVYFGGYGTNASAAYNKNVNLNFISATGINLKASDKGYTFGDEAAVQIINSSGKTITYDTALEADLFGNTAKVPTFEITNGTGIADIITFTETAGTFAVDSSKYIVTATADDGTTAESKDNLLVLTSPGKYTLSYRAVPREVYYYVSTTGDNANDGLTPKTPLQTIKGAIATATQDAIDGGWNSPENTVYLKVLNPPENSSAVIWAPDSEGATNTADYDFTLNISTYNDHDTALIGGSNCSIDFKGPVVFENIRINYSYYNSAPRFSLNGSNAVFKSDVTFTSNQLGGFLLGAGNAAATYTSPQTVSINTNINTDAIYLGSRYKTAYNSDLNLIYNVSDATQAIAFGSFASGYTTTYSANVNLDLRAAANVTLKKAAGEFVFDGAALQIINSTGNTVDYSAIEASLPENTYIITNNTGVKDLLTFTETAGTYTVDTEKYSVTAIAKDGTKTDAKDGSLMLGPGEYTLSINEAASDQYSDYIIDRGTGLANTYAKLKNGKKLNVVYFGGSITGGQGASDPATTSWRGLIGNWLKSAFPDATINNYNYAYGGTGSLFGIYRLKQEIFPLEPDLVFIDFAINDRYNGLSSEEITKNYESIIRNIRQNFPECDIVALHVTAKETVATDITELFHQAQLHENIAAAYDVPSLHIGRALANEVGSADNWSSYSDDTVHPTDDGYLIYHGVIKEYFNNNLLHGSYDGTITKHTVPEKVSTLALISTNVEYIDMTEEVVTESEANGGSGFSYGDGYSQLVAKQDAFKGGLQTAKADGTEDKLVVTFTGTELLAITHAHDLTSLKITVDGGEAVTVDTSSDIIPLKLVSGLTDTEHTAVIEPVYGSLSNSWMWLIGLYTRTGGTESNDVNADGTYDIRDLVFAADLIGTTSADEKYNGIADKDNDGDIDTADIALIRIELLTVT